MFGAITGDIIGSPYEFTFQNIKTKEFPLFCSRSKFTDDTVLTIAIANALLLTKGKKENIENCFIESMRYYGRLFPRASYGQKFILWLYAKDPKAYHSLGNGSAMRVSPIAWAYDTLDEVEDVAAISASVSHNHEEGIKGACSIASAIYLARKGKSQKEIKAYIIQRYGYDLERSLEEIRETTIRSERAEKTVPVAIIAFLHSTSFEDAIRTAISLGGDSDTIAAMCGSIAEAFYGGVPKEIWEHCYSLLAPELIEIVEEWKLWGKNN